MTDLEQAGIDTGAFRLRNGSVGLSLRFSREALSALISEIGAGFISIPRRGAEVGGVLAGKMTQENSEWVVSVDQISPVPIRYEYGPSWRLSAGEKEQFQQLVNNGRQRNRFLGWYRSNTRPEHQPEEADRQISHTLFGGGESIFLFCEPSADGQIHATCTIMLPHGVEMAFPFELGKFSRLDAMFHSREHDAEPASILAPPASISRGLASAAPVAAPTRSVLISRKVKIAAAALAMIGAFWYARARVFTPATASASTRLASPSPAPAPAPRLLLGLRADYQKDSLLIGWDRTAPEIASAASATFRIADGGRTRTLDLSARELQNGSIVYKPKADEISVELDVTSRDGSTASQSIRIVGAAVQPRAPRPFQPPPEASLAQKRGITTPDLPPVDAALARNRTRLLASGLPSLSEPLPGFAETRRESHAPEPIHSPQPVLPAGMRLPDDADRLLQIQVEVTVGIDGRVVAARLTDESGPWAGLLGPSALSTAQTWRFRPATLGGHPVQSTMVLTFRYDRPR